MRRRISSLLCATTLLVAGAGMVAIPDRAMAQVSMGIGFNYFHDRLARDGKWIRHPIWGDVWHPRTKLVGPDFQPYTNGYWELTDDYGWYWVSEDPFDDVVYHYGRWVYDPQWNWLWVPGYTWSPAWVVWREGDDYTGWMPMPPDEDFVSGAGLGFGVNIGPIGINFYNRWYGGRVDPDRFFVFVGNRNLVDRDYRRFRVPRDRVKMVIQKTRPVGKFEIVNNRVVNRGVDVRVVERATGRRIAPVSAKTVIKPGAVITTVNEAKQIRQRERAAHPIDVNAVKRGNAGNQNPETGAVPNGGKTPEETGTNAPGSPNEGRRGRNKTPSGTMNGPDNGTTAGGATPEAGDNGGGGRMRNPGGEEMPGTSNQGGNTNRMRRNGNGNAGPNANAPDQTGAAPSTNPEGPPPPVRRHRPGGTAAGPNQMEPSNTGAAPDNGSQTPDGNMPRRRGNNGGSMSGPNSTMGGNGAVPNQAGGMNGPSSGNQGMQSTQPGNTDTEPKKKRKRKPDQTQDSDSPQ